LDSAIVFGPWWLGVCGLALFFCSHMVVRRAQFALAQQERITIERTSAIAKPFEPKYAIAQLVFASIAFFAAVVVGEPVFTFVGGGFVVAYAMSLGLNIQALLSARGLGQAGNADGRLILAPHFAMRDWGYRALGAAAFLFTSGVVFAHLALLGGALILASGGYGYVRRSRKLPPQP